MIDIDRFSFWYAGASEPALADVSVSLDEGTFALVVGPTGSGKSTLLGAINGLVPHFTGGHVEGRVVTSGRDPRAVRPREFAGTVGVVGQDPLAGFVTDTVEEELAFGLEQLATPAPVMRRRVEEMLDALGIASLRRRALRTLSGGEQQRVAIGAALVAAPDVLVLDEPTSSLDPGAAEDVLAVVRRLVHDIGITVVAAEHRLERIVEYADVVLLVDEHRVRSGAPEAMMRESVLAPPVVELGRLAGWDPIRSRCEWRVGSPRHCGHRSATWPGRVCWSRRAMPRRAASRWRPGPRAWRHAESSCGTDSATWCAMSTWRSHREKSSRSWAATGPASPRCSGRSRGRVRWRPDGWRSTAGPRVT